MIPTYMFCDASQATQKDENKIVGCAQTSTTLVNVYVDLVVFTRIAGTS